MAAAPPACQCGKLLQLHPSVLPVQPRRVAAVPRVSNASRPHQMHAPPCSAAAVAASSGHNRCVAWRLPHSCGTHGCPRPVGAARACSGIMGASSRACATPLSPVWRHQAPMCCKALGAGWCFDAAPRVAQARHASQATTRCGRRAGGCIEHACVAGGARLAKYVARWAEVCMAKVRGVRRLLAEVVVHHVGKLP